MKKDFFRELHNMAITVCDAEGIILWMNDRSRVVNGEGLIGSNVLDCHPEPASSQLRSMMEHQTTNSYTIEKNGVKKLIYQAPWYENGEYAGFTEFSVEIPFEMPHFIRKPKQ